jgi:hypothetical protein
MKSESGRRTEGMKNRQKAALCVLFCCSLLTGCGLRKTPPAPDPTPEATAAPDPSPTATPRPVPTETVAETQQEKTDRDKEETVYIKAGADGEAREVTVLVDEALRRAPRVAFHPCVNTASLALSSDDFFDVFLKRLGYEPVYVTIHNFL